MSYPFRWAIPEKLPKELQAISEDLRSAKNQEDALHRAYEVVSRRFVARRMFTYLLFWRLFWRNLEKLWKRRGFVHCTHMNNILAILLVKSGWFQQSDIRRKWTLVSGLSPHQYLVCRMKNGKEITVDVWGRTYGIPFGKYAAWFRPTTFPVWSGSKSD